MYAQNQKIIDLIFFDILQDFPWFKPLNKKLRLKPWFNQGKMHALFHLFIVQFHANPKPSIDHCNTMTPAQPRIKLLLIYSLYCNYPPFLWFSSYNKNIKTIVSLYFNSKRLKKCIIKVIKKQYLDSSKFHMIKTKGKTLHGNHEPKVHASRAKDKDHSDIWLFEPLILNIKVMHLSPNC